jgi:hypothetical protein
MWRGYLLMEMIIDFPGGARVDAHFGPFTVATDQPPSGSAPTPFATFLASIGVRGIYVSASARGLPARHPPVQTLRDRPSTAWCARSTYIHAAGTEKYRLAGALRRAVRGQEALTPAAVRRAHGGWRGGLMSLPQNAEALST